MRIFPAQSLLVNEFEKIKLLLQEACSGHAGRQLAHDLRPSPSFDEALTRLRRTEEFRKIISNSEPLRIEPYPDVSNDIRLLSIRNSVLNTGQVIQLLKVTRLAKHIFDFFKEGELRYPALGSVVSQTIFEPVIITLIEQVTDDSGEIRSDASQELLSVRKQLSRKRLESSQIYQSVINKYRKNGWLTDAEESWRNGRRVISIFSEHKRSAKGIIHDISSSGKTCFIEPDEATGINNLISELQIEEQQEIYRILKDLSDRLRSHATSIRKYAEIIGELDLIAAKAHVALSMNASLPYFEDVPGFDLRDACHPLLYIYNKAARKPTVPFTLNLDQKNRILVISGPNAGGKTVCMKTTGLLQLMLQSGMLVTADANSRFGFFHDLLVDIGDSQSLEYELSTYSSRLKHMKHFLQKAGERTLFLIDEFGTGTDPDLGGALAEAILEELTRRKAIGIITTHYMNLKVLADRTPGLLNASMAFDSKKLEPLYKLEVGKPGSSYTFVVAERSGIPYPVINKAKKRVRKNSLQLEQTLNKLEREKAELGRLLSEAVKNESSLKSLIEKYRINIEKQESRKIEQEEKLRQKELRITTQTEQKFQRFVNEWKHAKNKKEVLLKYDKQFSGRKKELSEKEAARQQELLKSNQENIKKGSRVRLKNGRVTGIVEQIRDGKVHVRFGNVKSVTELQNLIYIE